MRKMGKEGKAVPPPPKPGHDQKWKPSHDR
jgi:hypothetical protein